MTENCPTCGRPVPKARVMHLARVDRDGWPTRSACGLSDDESQMSSDVEAVTCGACKGTVLYLRSLR